MVHTCVPLPAAGARSVFRPETWWFQRCWQWEWLSGLLAPLTVLRAIDHPNRDYVNVSSSDFTGLYRPGIVHPPHDLAALLLHLARATQPSEAKAGAHPGALRYVSTNSNNGWSSCVAAAYLHRTRGSAFHGYAVNDLKTEVSAQKIHPRLYKL